MYLSTADRAKQIRTTLKQHGISSRQVSVRSDSYSMGSSINVTVRDVTVDFALVERTANAHEKISRCEFSGEILSGGNTYVSVRYDDDALKAFAATLDPVAPVVNGFRIYSDTDRSGEFYACRWPEGDGPKCASATVRGWGLPGVVGAALAFSDGAR